MDIYLVVLYYLNVWENVLNILDCFCQFEVMGDLYYKVVCDSVFEFFKIVIKWDVN